jgi:hypothetical protein
MKESVETDNGRRKEERFENEGEREKEIFKGKRQIERK